MASSISKPSYMDQTEAGMLAAQVGAAAMLLGRRDSANNLELTHGHGATSHPYGLDYHTMDGKVHQFGRLPEQDHIYAVHATFCSSRKN